MRVVDLFSGIGGFTEAAEQAGCRVVWTGNHWRIAVDYHALNHPRAIHVCQDLHQADWRELPKFDMLCASPACTGHTPARGKDRPHHDSARSTAWAVVSALEFHRPPVFLVENVTQFADWTLYRAWCSALHALGYALSPYITDAADHGVPQHRKRLFIAGTLSKHPIQLRLPVRPHVAADSFIDWDAGRWNPVNKLGRSEATLSRIESGRSRFGERFLAPYYGSGSGKTGRCVSRPIGTITTRDRWAVINGDRMRILTKEENRAAMGFRSSYVLPNDHKLAVHMLGNAVCPPQAYDYITAIKEAA
jgi:DNA (cytosine-5)-methyltransferase 1